MEALVSQEKKQHWSQTVRGNVLMMGLVSLFTDFSSEMIYPLLPVFLAGLPDVGIALAALYVGLLEGVAETTASLLKIFAGRISDSLGKRKALVVGGYGVSTVARPLMAVAMAGWHVVALRFLDRIGKGVRTSPRDALIGDSVGPDSRGLAFSFHRAMDHTGAIIGPVVSVGILALFLGYGLWHGEKKAPTPNEMHAMRWLFAIALVPGLAAMAVLIGRVREIAPKTSAEEHDKPNGWKALPGRYYAFVAIVTVFALGNSSDLFLVFYAREKFQLGLASLLGLWIVLHVSKIAFSLPGGILSDRLGRRPMIVLGWGVYALVYLGMAFLTEQWQFWALLVAYGFYYGMTEGAEKAMVADLSPGEHRGAAFGLYHGAVGIAALPASLMFGVFWSQIGPRIAFGIGAALAGAAAVGLIVLLSATRTGAKPDSAAAE